MGLSQTAGFTDGQTFVTRIALPLRHVASVQLPTFQDSPFYHDNNQYNNAHYTQYTWSSLFVKKKNSLWVITKPDYLSTVYFSLVLVKGLWKACALMHLLAVILYLQIFLCSWGTLRLDLWVFFNSVFMIGTGSWIIKMILLGLKGWGTKLPEES